MVQLIIDTVLFKKKIPIFMTFNKHRIASSECDSKRYASSTRRAVLESKAREKNVCLHYCLY